MPTPASTIGDWLMPRATQGYDSAGNREAFMSSNGELGKVALHAWEIADHAHCDMPDEYLGYAERFVEIWERESIPTNELSNLLVREVVRRCHGAAQIAEGWVTDDHLDIITDHIVTWMRQEDMDIKERNTPLLLQS